ncbi:MAG: ATP-binding protein [Candidatus Dojkabacteria bacterium]|nr:ATP-binding protein [Candidatus Dojkabacteria bacterium]
MSLVMPRIFRASELGTSSRPLRCLVYGDSGIGKTTMLATLPKPLLVIDFEGGSDIRLINQDNVFIAPVYSRQELSSLLEYIKGIIEDNSIDFKSIAFDGFSVFIQQCLREILSENNKNTPTFKEWQILTSYIKSVILGLINYTTHTVFTALSKKKITQDKEERMNWIGPDLPKSIREYLRAICDLEGYIYRSDKGNTLIAFNSQQQIVELKDRSGKLGKLEEPDFEKIFSKIFV